MIDPSLVFAWQVAHSVARGPPAPVRDRGGYRVDTDSESEVKRWVFPHLGEGVVMVGREVDAPGRRVGARGRGATLGRGCPPPR